MDKKKLALLIIAGAIVTYLLIRPRQSVAAPVQQPVASAPASPPPPDLGTQLAGIGAQVTAGLGAINTAASTIPTIVPSVTTAVAQAQAAAAAIPAQIDTVISAAGTQITTAATTTGQAIAASAPYILPVAALSIVLAGATQTHRTFDPTVDKCCDTSLLAQVNCHYDPVNWGPMQCLLEIYDYASWTYEQKRAHIFQDLGLMKGVVNQYRRIIPAVPGRDPPRTIYEGTGVPNLPNLMSILYPKYFRILTPQDQILYRQFRDEIVAYNQTLVKSETVYDIQRGCYTFAKPPIDAVYAGPCVSRQTGGSFYDVKVPRAIPGPTLFNVEWLY